MRQLRPDMADTVDALHFWDGSNRHRDIQSLAEIGEHSELGYPISGDDLALATYEGEPK